MTEVFIINIQDKIQADKVSTSIRENYSDLKINFDLNETELPFPCGRTVLRVEGNEINSDGIIATIDKLGFNCKILEDRLCV